MNESDRVRALVLRRSVMAMEGMITRGERESAALVREGMQMLEAVRVDYLAVVDAETLLPVTAAATGTLVAVAAWVGGTRLIDNFVVA